MKKLYGIAVCLLKSMGDDKVEIRIEAKYKIGEVREEVLSVAVREVEAEFPPEGEWTVVKKDITEVPQALISRQATPISQVPPHQL